MTNTPGIHALFRLIHTRRVEDCPDHGPADTLGTDQSRPSKPTFIEQYYEHSDGNAVELETCAKIREGEELIAVLGAPGAGKTTLLYQTLLHLMATKEILGYDVIDFRSAEDRYRAANSAEHGFNRCVEMFARGVAEELIERSLARRDRSLVGTIAWALAAEAPVQIPWPDQIARPAPEIRRRLASHGVDLDYAASDVVLEEALRSAQVPGAVRARIYEYAYHTLGPSAVVAAVARLRMLDRIRNPPALGSMDHSLTPYVLAFDNIDVLQDFPQAAVRQLANQLRNALAPWPGVRVRVMVVGRLHNHFRLGPGVAGDLHDVVLPRFERYSDAGDVMPDTQPRRILEKRVHIFCREAARVGADGSVAGEVGVLAALQRHMAHEVEEGHLLGLANSSKRALNELCAEFLLYLRKSFSASDLFRLDSDGRLTPKSESLVRTLIYMWIRMVGRDYGVWTLDLLGTSPAGSFTQGSYAELADPVHIAMTTIWNLTRSHADRQRDFPQVTRVYQRMRALGFTESGVEFALRSLCGEISTGTMVTRSPAAQDGILTADVLAELSLAELRGVHVGTSGVEPTSTARIGLTPVGEALIYVVLHKVGYVFGRALEGQVDSDRVISQWIRASERDRIEAIARYAGDRIRKHAVLVTRFLGAGDGREMRLKDYRKRYCIRGDTYAERICVSADAFFRNADDGARVVFDQLKEAFRVALNRHVESGTHYQDLLSSDITAVLDRHGIRPPRR